MTRSASRLLAPLLAWRIGRTGAPEFAFLVLVGLFMGTVGAFDTGKVDPLHRYLYWVLVMPGGGLIGALIEVLLWRIPALARRPVLLAGVQAVAMTPPIAVLVWLVGLLTLDYGLWHLRILLTTPNVLIVDVAVVILAVLFRRAVHRAAPAPAPSLQPASAFAAPGVIAAKLTPRLARADLLAVESEDHYLRVHTSEGDALILMRFADALEALAGCDGVRTHRSWWVARRAVQETRFSRGRGELSLSNGVKAPVSRTYAAELRDAGWA